MHDSGVVLGGVLVSKAWHARRNPNWFVHRTEVEIRSLPLLCGCTEFVLVQEILVLDVKIVNGPLKSTFQQEVI